MRPEHKLEDQLARDLVARAEKLHAEMLLFKLCAFNDVRALLALLGEKYEVKLGGTRGGVKLHSYDGLLRVTISVADLMTFGPELRAAKALIDECITEWSKGANENILAIINDAFSVGEGGKLQVDRVLALRRLEIADRSGSGRWARSATRCAWCRRGNISASTGGRTARPTSSRRSMRARVMTEQESRPSLGSPGRPDRGRCQTLRMARVAGPDPPDRQEDRDPRWRACGAPRRDRRFDLQPGAVTRG